MNRLADSVKFGNTTSCTEITIDTEKGEFVQNVTMFYTSQRIQAMTLRTNFDQIVSVGTNLSLYKNVTWNWNQTRPLTAFYGNEEPGQFITTLSTISTNLATC